MIGSATWVLFLVAQAAADPPATQPAHQAEPPPASTPAATTSQPNGEEGWITTDSGLKYKDAVEGQGPTPQPYDLLKLRYQGTLEDGTPFDSTEPDGQPRGVRLGIKPPRLMPGWEEGLAGMKAGGRRAMIIPPHLGYGLRGKPPTVPANATLRYEFELLEIVPVPKMTETKLEDEVTTDSGLRYVEIKMGEGVSAAEDSVLKLRAVTWRADGVFLDSTTEREDPTSVAMVSIRQPAIKEGLKGMKAGGKRKLLVSRPLPPTTQPTTQPAPLQMIVEVELLEVAPPPKITATPEDQYVATPSGLKYYDLKVGEGESPKETSRVKVHFTGWLESGTMFDSSVVRGEPAEFSLDGVIKGWGEGLVTMKVGGKRKLVIPSDLGFGEEGGPGIPPSSTLIIEVELLKIIQP